MEAHHEHQLVAEDVLVRDSERSTESKIALRLARRIVAKGEQVPSRSLETVDDTIASSGSSATGSSANLKLVTRDVDSIVEEEVSLKELDALTDESGSLVAFNLDHADLIVQVVDVVKVRRLVTDHQIDGTRSLALTRCGEVRLTHLATTVDSKRANVFVLVVPARDCTSSRAGARKTVDGVGRRRGQLHEAVASSSVRIETSVAVQGGEAADLTAITST